MLVGRDGGAIVATAMVGHDGHRGWVYYVAADPDHRGKGYGRAIMEAAEDWLRAAGIAKLQLMVRPDNAKVQAFYQSIGYGEQQTHRSSPNGSTAASRRRNRKSGQRMTISDRVRIKDVRVLSRRSLPR